MNWKNLPVQSEQSDRQIAQALGVHHDTVGVQRREMERIGEISQSSRQTKDGRIYPAIRKPVSVFNPTKREERAMKKPEVVAQMQEAEDMTVQQAYNALKKQAIQQRIAEHAGIQTGTVDIASTDRKYNIIYADPAWQYWEGGNKNQSLHYTTMTIEDICALPVKNIADDNCVLFLWVTYPILPDAFRVIESWGFKYSTAAFVWVKKNKKQGSPFIGCGSWTRANSELCLLATKGNVTRLDASISQIVESPIEEHSRKPAIVRELITRLVGELPRIELFCRTPVDGWDVWGNEV